MFGARGEGKEHNTNCNIIYLYTKPLGKGSDTAIFVLNKRIKPNLFSSFLQSVSNYEGPAISIHKTCIPIYIP